MGTRLWTSPPPTTHSRESPHYYQYIYVLQYTNMIKLINCNVFGRSQCALHHFIVSFVEKNIWYECTKINMDGLFVTHHFALVATRGAQLEDCQRSLHKRGVEIQNLRK